jgi:aminobenzoyl-glutamate transport protein
MKRWMPHIALGLFFAQLLLMLGSWICSAAYPLSGVRSLLSGEGLRWLMAHFADTLSTPLLVWLLLGAMAYGVVRRSGLLAFRRRADQPLPTVYRESRARIMTLLLLVAYIGVLLLLTVVPHAVLLSATGRLWPSPFTQSIIPLTAFAAIVLGAFYGIVAGRLTNLRAVYDALLDGIRAAAPLMLFYVLLMQLYASLLFVLM